MTDICNHPTSIGGCDHCWIHRCEDCGTRLIDDGTEEADWATMCPQCDEESRADMDGDLSEPL